MSNYYNDDDPTRPAYPPGSNQGQRGQDGKLVLGNFKDGQRRPYQYRPDQNQQVQPTRPAQPGNAYQGSPRQNYPYQQQGSPYNSYAGVQQSVQDIPPGGGSYASGRGQMANRPQKRRKRGRGCAIGCLSMLVILLIAGFILVPMAQRILAFGSAISVVPNQSPLSSQTGYMGTSERTNLLVLGYGGGDHSGAYLTDSVVLVSLMPQSHHTSLISTPRDLWVQNPANSGRYSKLNTVYVTAAGLKNQNPAAGGEAAMQKIALITGMDVKYWLTIDFTGFKQVIDSIGGVDVYVPDSFNACYPKNDDAAKDASWIKVDFKKGQQHMDGATAIAYARAREPLSVCGMGKSENLTELTDFGRSARQQIIIKAVLGKVKDSSSWPHLYDAMGALQQTIHTNLSLADLASFAMKLDLNDPKSAKIGLSNQNILMDTYSDDGQAILAPKNNDWKTIPTYIQGLLYA